MNLEEKTEKIRLASQHVQRGSDWEAAGELQRAEEEYKKAALLHLELSEKSGEKMFFAAAREDFEHLADINMQQGNLHGADRCYVLSMECRQRMEEE